MNVYKNIIILIYMYSYILILLCFVLCNAEYNTLFAKLGVHLLSVAYCNTTDYYKINLEEPINGFEIYHTIYDNITDTNGFIGFFEKYKTINIVIRGTESNTDIITDIKVLKTKYSTWPECKCNVHNGFYQATKNIKDQIIDVVEEMIKKRPTYKIIIYGHSLGGAVSNLLSMELVKANITTSVYTYGSPRVGDKKYALFFNTKINNHYRHVNNTDIVPHIPSNFNENDIDLVYKYIHTLLEYFNNIYLRLFLSFFGIGGTTNDLIAKNIMNLINPQLDYYHPCQEIFFNENKQIIMCNGCEDKKCSAKYKLYELSVKSHSVYFNVTFSKYDNDNMKHDEL